MAKIKFFKFKELVLLLEQECRGFIAYQKLASYKFPYQISDYYMEQKHHVLSCSVASSTHEIAIFSIF